MGCEWEATVLTRKPQETSEERPAQNAGGSLSRSKTFKGPKAADEFRIKDLVLGSPLTGSCCHGNNLVYPTLSALQAYLTSCSQDVPFPGVICLCVVRKWPKSHFLSAILTRGHLVAYWREEH